MTTWTLSIVSFWLCCNIKIKLGIVEINHMFSCLTFLLIGRDAMDMTSSRCQTHKPQQKHCHWSTISCLMLLQLWTISKTTHLLKLVSICKIRYKWKEIVGHMILLPLLTKNSDLQAKNYELDTQFRQVETLTL